MGLKNEKKTETEGLRMMRVLNEKFKELNERLKELNGGKEE